MPTSRPSPKPKAAAPAPAKRPAHRPPHEPTKVDRDTVSVMVAGGIAREDIARARGISQPTLRKYYKLELATGAAVINSIVLFEHMKRIKAGDFHAIKWWEQARMRWSERIVVDDGKPADTPMRVIIEYVGEAAPSRVEPSAPRSGSRISENLRQTVQLVG